MITLKYCRFLGSRQWREHTSACTYTIVRDFFSPKLDGKIDTRFPLKELYLRVHGKWHHAPCVICEHISHV